MALVMRRILKFWGAITRLDTQLWEIVVWPSGGKETYTADHFAGNLSGEWSSRLGLSKDVIVGVGAFDAHMGAVGGQIEPYHLSKVMGTSTCDMLVAPNADMKGKLVKVLIAGMC